MTVCFSNDDVLYNEGPIKCTIQSIDSADCVFYHDLPSIMNEEEELEIKNFKYKKPTLEQAVEDYKCGCEEAFNFLYKHYKKKFGYVAAKYNNEDLVQELSMVLYHCCQKYEPGGSSGFNTLLWTAAQNHVGMIQIRNNSKKRKNEFGEISLDATLSDMDVTLENVIEDVRVNEEYEDVLFYTTLTQNILPQLNDEERHMVLMIVNGYSVKEVAAALHLNTPSIYMRLKRMREREGLSEILKALYYKNGKKESA